MSLPRSDKFYFPRGDLVILVGNLLFRVHRDIVEQHSGFFQDLFSQPSSDDKEGTTDDSPLCLPNGLCSAQAFSILCKFFYPRPVGVVPSVMAKDLDIWEPVLEATVALQIPDVQAAILSKLQADRDFPTVASRLLKIATKIDVKDLKTECIRALAYRVQPLSLAEGVNLGAALTVQVMDIREKVRQKIYNRLNWETMDVSETCKKPQHCRSLIVNMIQATLGQSPVSKPNIFDIDDHPNLCGPCRSCRLDLAAGYKRDKLDPEVDQRIAEWELRARGTADSAT